MDQSQPTFLPHNLFCLEGNAKPETTEWHNNELKALLSKEETNPLDDAHPLLKYRVDAVNWMLKIHSHYSFNSLTAVLAVNYFDRFIRSPWLPSDKPWIAQLVAIACLSLAAKVEETHVPLLMDLQVDDEDLLFEPKTIKRMEMTILSTLEWKMHPITPLAFLDYVVSEWIGLSVFQCCELRRRCDLLILFLLTDHRISHYTPSAVAAAVLLQITMKPETSFGSDLEMRLQSLLQIDKLKLEECRKLIENLIAGENRYHLNKRKFAVVSRDPGSPDGVIDISFSSDSELSTVTSASSSPEPISKRSKSFAGDSRPDFRRIRH